MMTEYLVPAICESVKRYPRKIAVKSERKSVSYLDLEKKSNRVANFMHGKIKEIPHVIILLDRSPELIEAIIGLLKSGLVFVPLNPGLPGNRIKKMIEEVKAEWVITSVQYYDKLKDILMPGGSGPRLKTRRSDGDRDTCARLNTLLIDGDKNTCESVDNVFMLDPALEDGGLEFERDFNDHCYIYFTSGSTGIPKGVLGRQTGLAHFLQWEIKEFAVDEHVKVSQFTPPTFDPYLRDIFLPLMTGGTSCIPSNNTLSDIRELIRWIDKNEITFIHTIPSLFKALISEIDDSDCFHYLKYILLAGELLRGRDIHRFIEIFKNRIQLVNVYGPTETTLAKLFYRIKPEDANRTIIPVGKPIEGAQVLILNSKQQKCHVGKKGEIYIRTPFRSAGYYNDPDFNKKHFIKNPFGKNPRDIIYKTGDLGCFLPDGGVELSGRIDFQVKIRGMRIELAEIENRLLKHGGVREVVVTAGEDEKADKYLCAYAVLVPGKKPAAADLKEFLAEDLPDYMTPAYFVFLDNIPLTPNGKVDRKALPEPGFTPGQNYTAPRNEVEKKLAEIWAQVLGRNPQHESQLRESIDIDDNFFELGGHSLKANLLRSWIFKTLNVQIPLRELFRVPTIKGLAGYINTASRDKFTSVEPAEKKEYYALSPAQERLYVLYRFDTNSTAYHITNMFSLEGNINKDKLEETFRNLIARHESLRTSFKMVEGEPVQRIHSPEDIEFEIEQHSPGRSVQSAEQKELVTEREEARDAPCAMRYASIIERFIRPFDLSEAPLLRVGLIREGNSGDQTVLMIDIHHIVTDGTSQGILVRDFVFLYDDRELPPLTIMYKEYSQWQHKDEVKEALKKQEEYWIREFHGEIPILNLPTDYPRPLVQSFAGSRIAFEINEAETKALNQISQKEGTTLFMVLLAIFNVFLSKLSTQEEIVVGTPIAGRRHADLDQVIGMFVNTLALYNYPSGAKTFAAFLAETREKTVSAFENQDYPFEALVEKIELQRDLNRNPLFDVMFVFQNLNEANEEMSEQAAGNLTIKPYAFERGTSKFDLTLITYERGEKLNFTLEYSTKLFGEETILRFIQYFKKMLSSIRNNPGKKIADVEILSEEEKKKLLVTFNDNEEFYPKDKTIFELFEEEVDKIPHHPALIFHDKTNTYRFFDKQANRLANYLRREKGIQAGDRIVVLMDRSIELFVVLLGVMKAGGAYIPMDVSLPAERLRVVIADASVGLVFSLQKYLEKLVPVQQQCKMFHTILCMDDPGSGVDKYPAARPGTGNPGGPAYVMYTSGSSGIPKGVLVEHRTIVNTLMWRKNNYEYAPGFVSLQVPPYFFDSSVTDIFTPLLGGACLVLVTEEERSDLEVLRRLIIRHKVTHFIVVPVFYNLLLEEIPADLKGLKMICCAGENFPDELIKKHFDRLPEVRIFNEYGPTENSVNTTAYELRPDSPKALIGKPTSNVSVYILDRYSCFVPIGVVGEMCLGGSSLAQGYLNSPELTAEKFITAQSNKSFVGVQGAVFQKSPLPAGGKEIYKSGDMARWLSDGNLEFSGRVDSQVKIRGIRVETGEIESQLMRLENIKEAIVQIRQDESGVNYLCAYVVPKSQTQSPLEPSELKEYLFSLLPNYMVPSYFLELEKLPLTPNGKLDINALPDPTIEPGGEYTAPRNEIEKKLVEIWQGVLGINNIGVNDNFFHIGGDSIKSIQIMSRMNGAGYKLDMKDLFRYPVISDLAPHVKKLRRIPDQSPVTGTIPLTPIQQQFFNASHIAASHYNQAVMFYARQGFDKEVVKAVFTRIQEHHDALRVTYKIYPQKDSVIQTAHGLDLPLSLHEYDLKDQKNSREELKTKINEIQAGIDLEKGPLMKLGLFHLDDGDRLLIIFHHLVIDGVSWRILFEDIETLYSGYVRGEEPVLPAKTGSFKQWAIKLSLYADSKTFLKEKPYWVQLESQTVPPIPKDFQAEENVVEDSRSISFDLGEDETILLLNKVNKVYNTEISDILLTALAMAIKKSFAQDRVLIALEGHGREDIPEGMDISRTVGWFTSEYPVLLDVSYSDDTGRQVKEVKETLRKIPNKGMGYGILKYLTRTENKKEIDFKLKPQIIFNYLGQFDADVGQISFCEIAEESVGNLQGAGNRREYEIEINGMTTANRLSMTLSYNRTQFKPETIRALAGLFESEIRHIIAFCLSREKVEQTPSDFTYKDLSIASIDRLKKVYPDAEDIYTLTPMQEGMLFHSLVDDLSYSYFEQASYRLQAELDIDLVEKSLNTLVQRHDILRTAFVHKDIERSVQVVLKNRRIDFYYEDISSLNGKEVKESFVREFKTKDKERSFDLSKDILMRVSILRLDESEYEFTWSFYHILMDGWCVGILNSEFFRVYSAYAAGRQPRLAVVKPYRTYIQWLEKQDKEASAGYWADYLDSFVEQTGIPRAAGIPKEEKQSAYKNEKFSVELSKEKAAQLNKLAAGYSITLNILTRTIWGILLGKYNGKKDVVFGAVVSGRPFELDGVESMVGLFINTIPVRICFAEKMKFFQLLQQVQEEAIAAEPYHYHPLAEIQSASSLKQNLIDHLFIFENYPVAEQMEAYGGEGNIITTSSFKVTDVDVFEQTNYDFNVLLAGTDRLRITFQYNENVYDSDIVKRIAGHYLAAFDQVIENEELAVAELTFLSVEEKHRLLYEFNDTAVEYPAGKTIHELFEEQVKKTPDNTALVGAKHSLLAQNGTTSPLQSVHLTYRELNEKSNRLAYGLMGKGIEIDTIVGIMVERYIEMVIGLLGILKAGGAYMPIDPGLPEDRKQYMFRESAAKILLTTRNLNEEVKMLRNLEVETVFIEDIGSRHEALGIREKHCRGESMYSPVSQPLNLLTSQPLSSSKNLAYVIYTSGSTGKPKGVMITHQNVVNFIQGIAADIRFLPGKTILAVTTISFDIFVLETYVPLAKGLKLILADRRQQADPAALAELLVKHDVQMVQFTPSRLKMLLIDKAYPDKLRQAVELMVGGEAFPIDLFKDVKKGFKGKIYNMYGPTETTVWSTFKNLTEKDNIDIGSPIANTQVYILDHFDSIQPVGVAGELCIAGDGLARGYLNRPEFTAERFISDKLQITNYKQITNSKFQITNKHEKAVPHHSSFITHHSDLLYKTGDLARWLPQGDIEFLGRIDHQVKIRGFRVELGEIENLLKEFPTVKEAVVIDRNDGERQYLCAYFTDSQPSGQENVPTHGLKEYLEGKLPGYMIPACFVKIDRIPLNPNGKIDRNKLPQPMESDFHSGSTYQAPTTNIQRMIAETWKEVLGREKVGIRDNFFDLGGNSLDFVTVSSKLKEKLGQEIAVVTLFNYPTIGALENYLTRDQEEEIVHEDSSYRPELVDEGIDFMFQTLKKLDSEDL